MQKVRFEDLEEARLVAGYFVDELADQLGFSERSYYRWKADGFAPKWVSIALNLLCGRLDHLGWKGWYISEGVLYHQMHHPDQYFWKQSDLLHDRFLIVNKTLAQHAWSERKKPVQSVDPLPESTTG